MSVLLQPLSFYVPIVLPTWILKFGWLESSCWRPISLSSKTKRVFCDIGVFEIFCSQLFLFLIVFLGGLYLFLFCFTKVTTKQAAWHQTAMKATSATSSYSASSETGPVTALTSPSLQQIQLFQTQGPLFRWPQKLRVKLIIANHFSVTNVIFFCYTG